MLTWLKDNASVFDAIVRHYLIDWWYGLILLELLALLLISLDVKVHLVSQTARGIAFGGFTALAWAWGAMTVHWFVTWRRTPFTTYPQVETALGVLFWFITVIVVIASFLDPEAQYWPEWAKTLRYPPHAALGGGMVAWIAFPQRSLWTL